ncbi:hypothetical protein BAU15_13765 [Enterococcus sp. JM4C]|nr:hypothetical protein BAU15_13765 [Enterococcus sp. JM4C]
MNLARKLSYYRKEAGFSQIDVVAELDISKQVIFDWETGQAQPDRLNLVLLSHLYGVPLQELVKENEPIEAPINLHRMELLEKKKSQKKLFSSNVVKHIVTLAIMLTLAGIGIRAAREIGSTLILILSLAFSFLATYILYDKFPE